MRIRRKGIVTALAASLAAVGLATASPASAQVYGPDSCISGSMTITNGAGALQCFQWDGIVGGSRGGSYLFVNDWYTRVNAGMYKLTVSWHDIKTGEWTVRDILPWGFSNQPTGDSMLYSITFDSQ